MPTYPLERYFATTRTAPQVASASPVSPEPAPVNTPPTAPTRGRPRGRPRGRGRDGTATTRPVPSQALPSSEDIATTAIPARRGRGRGGKTRAARMTPYRPDRHMQGEWLGYAKLEQWNEHRDSQLKPGIKRLDFEASFPIADEHLDAIVALGPSFCHGITYFSAGDEETGNGASLNQAAVIRLAAALPNLVHMELRGALGVKDDALLALFANCPKLRHMRVSGNDRVGGNVKGPALNALRDDPSMCPSLVELRLTDQTLYDKVFDRAVKTLSAARKHLKIEVGSTQDEGPQKYWKGGKEKWAMDEYLASDGWKPREWYREAQLYKAARDRRIPSGARGGMWEGYTVRPPPGQDKRASRAERYFLGADW